MVPRQHESPTAARQRLSVGKKLLFSVIAGTAFFLLVELILALTGVQTVLDREDPTRGFSGLVSVLVPDGTVYRTRRTAEQTFNDQSFLTEKPANGLRLFCLGGSSAYGYPWGAEVAFTSILGDLLAEAHPDRTVEAINLSGISYAMYRLGFVARELMEHQPDIIVIYSGHNEFIEPAFFAELKERSIKRSRFELLLARSRLYSALRAALPVKGSHSSQEFDLDVRRDQSVVFTPDDKTELLEAYRSGLRQIVQMAHGHSAHVVLATIPGNLRDWKPNKSVMDGSLDDSQQQQWLNAFRAGERLLKNRQFQKAAEQLSRAVSLAPTHADTHFLLAKAYDGAEQWAEARHSYQRACDYDASPIRRLSVINDAVKEVASEERATLVDIELVFEEASPHGLVGLNLIGDYVHPTIEGHQLIARHLWQAIERERWAGTPAVNDEDLYERIIESRPPVATENAPWFHRQGVLLEHQGQLVQAMEKYQRAIEIDPSYTHAFLNLGRLLVGRGEAGEAINHFNAILKVDPQNASAHNNMGAALRSSGRLDEAIQHYQRAVELAPKSAPFYSNLATALMAKGELDQAFRYYQRALDLDPDLIAAHSKLGVLHTVRGDVEAAKARFADALRLDPADAAAHRGLANLLMQEGDLQAAKNHFKQALQSNADYLEAHNGLAELLRSQGKWAEAIAHLEHAVNLAPADVGLRSWLGMSLSMIDRHAEAIQHWRAALEIEPQNAGLHINLGNVLLYDGKLDEAVSHYREALAIQPDHAEGHYNLGFALSEQGNFELAIEHYQDALRIRPDYAAAHHNLGLAYQAIGEEEKAAQHFRRAGKSEEVSE